MPADPPWTGQTVWALHMWDPPEGPDPDAPQVEDCPGRPPGCFLGVFATRHAAMRELWEWVSPEALRTMAWTTPGPDPDYQELRGGPHQHWFSLGAEPIWTGPTVPLPYLLRQRRGAPDAR